MKKFNILKILDFLNILSLLLFPMLIVSIIISFHSNMLITKNLRAVAIVLLIIVSIIIFTKIIVLSKNKGWKKIYKKNRGLKIFFTIFMIFYTIGATISLILLYGPNPKFKDWLVTTAMNTMTHKHYCQWFYSEDEIDEVFSRNYFEEIEESTDESLINVDNNENNEDDIIYENEYEREILVHDKNDPYKIIRFTVNDCNAYLAVIYDPSRVSVTTAKHIGVTGEYVVDMAKRENALVATNGGGFYDPGFTSAGGYPKGITIVDGKIITNNEYGKPTTSGGLIGFTKDNKLILLKNTTAKEALNKGVRDAVSWGPFLIVNGKSAFSKGNGGWGYAARTVIGQRADGIVLLLVVDSNATRTKGASMVQVTKIMENYGAINAANLDGGTSSSMVERGVLISNPVSSDLSHRTRHVPTAIIVK